MTHRAEEYAYFMIRLLRHGAEEETTPLAGVVERIGSGEKRSFTSGEELLRFMCGRTAPDPSIPAAPTPRNHPEERPGRR